MSDGYPGKRRGVRGSRMTDDTVIGESYETAVKAYLFHIRLHFGFMHGIALHASTFKLYSACSKRGFLSRQGDPQPADCLRYPYLTVRACNIVYLARGVLWTRDTCVSFAAVFASIRQCRSSIRHKRGERQRASLCSG